MSSFCQREAIGEKNVWGGGNKLEILALKNYMLFQQV